MIRFNNEKNQTEIAIIEIFKSIDGEAFHSGQVTVFVRTMACNLRCKFNTILDHKDEKSILNGFCDTPECFSEKHFKLMYPNKELMWLTVDEIVEKLESIEKDWRWKSICLTGGEPLMEENKIFMTELIQKLVDLKYGVNIETNGSIDYSYWREKFPVPEVGDLYGNRQGVTLITDWKLPSSKMEKSMKWENLIKVLTPFDIVKCVITDDEEDWKEFEKVCKLTKDAKIFLSPCFGRVTMSKIPEFVMNHPEYNITAQIQAHKVFWDPDTKGV